MKKSIKVNLNSSYVTYFGDITVKVVDKKGVQKGKTKTFKNNGRWPLFSFLTTCLDGNYDTAENMRPRFINLFHADDAGATVPNISDDRLSPEIKEFAKEDKKRTLITYSYVENNISVPAEGEGQLGSSSITYKFTIPFAHINTSDDINMICLYSKENYNVYENPSAFFFVKDIEDKTKLGSLLSNETTNKNYNLLIEWTLTFKNITKSN